MLTLILAKNTQEANHYAKVAGLPRFTYRAVRNAGAIRGVRNAEVHILDSFTGRIDRHNILAALRYARLEVFYVVFRNGEIYDPDKPARFAVGSDGVATEGPERVPAVDVRDRTALMQDMSDLLEDYDPAPGLIARGVMADPEDKEPSEQTPAPEQSEDPAPAAEPKRRRRRTRCQRCGQLHYKEEPCAQVYTPPAPLAQPPADFF